MLTVWPVTTVCPSPLPGSELPSHQPTTSVSDGGVSTPSEASSIGTRGASISIEGTRISSGPCSGVSGRSSSTLGLSSVSEPAILRTGESEGEYGPDDQGQADDGQPHDEPGTTIARSAQAR